MILPPKQLFYTRGVFELDSICMHNCTLIARTLNLHTFKHGSVEPSIDVLPSKNQVLCEYCAHVSYY